VQSFSLRTTRSPCLHFLRAAFAPHALQPPHNLLLPAEVVVQRAVPATARRVTSFVRDRLYCSGTDALCKQRIVLERARVIGLVHVSVGAAHAISGGGDAGIGCCCCGRMYAAAECGCVVAGDEGERETRDVAEGGALDACV